MSVFLADRSILEPLLERRASSGARVEDLPLKEDGENRISKSKRKEWSLSKSQVIAEKAPEPDLMVKRKKKKEKKKKRERTKTPEVSQCVPCPLRSSESPDRSLSAAVSGPAACGRVRSQVVLRKARTASLSL